MTIEQIRDEALTLDRDDPLAKYREQFHLPRSASGAEHAYLCGNSLGLAPKQARGYIESEVRAWTELGVDGHFKQERPWVSYHELFSEHLARVVGARSQEVVAMNTLTVNLHLMMITFYQPTLDRFKVLVTHTPFPSDRYAVASQIGLRGFHPEEAVITIAPRAGEETVRTEDILETIEKRGSEIALVMMDGVNYYTGELLDMRAITDAAHRKEIIAGFDLAHAIGNVPLDLHGWDVDFAVWCSYKYLNGGPGCVGGCFVHERHGVREQPLVRCAGWWGHDKNSRFAMGPEFDPIPGAEGWQLSNPPLFSLAPLRASLELFTEEAMERIRAKSELLTGYFHRALRSHFGDWIDVITPEDPARRGSQLSLRIKRDARATFSRLVEQGVICDWREPDVVRLAPVALYNRFSDLFRCLEVLGSRGPR